MTEVWRITGDSLLVAGSKPPKKKEKKFRSGLESAFKKKYVPDFIDKRTGAMIECKGFFRVGDTQKYKAVRDEIDRPLIFVFTNSSKKLRKGSKMTLGQWCEKEGLAHFTMKSIDELLEHLKCLPSRK